MAAGVYDSEYSRLFIVMKSSPSLSRLLTTTGTISSPLLVSARSSTSTSYRTAQRVRCTKPHNSCTFWLRRLCSPRYPKATRMSFVKRYYDATSKHRINIPTPVMAGVRTPLRQYASCVLIDSDDSLDSIFSSDMAIGRYVAQRAGIGINAGRIRGLNSRIRGGEVSHTGVIPFLKKFESTVRCCTQNGIRGGSATVHFPIWHQEIEDIMVLKNNKGTEDNRVRKLDYSIQMSKIFYTSVYSEWRHYTILSARRSGSL